MAPNEVSPAARLRLIRLALFAGSAVIMALAAGLGPRLDPSQPLTPMGAVGVAVALGSPLLSFVLGRSLASGPARAADAPARELQRGLVSAAVLDGAVVLCAALSLAGAGPWPLLAAFLPLGLLGLSLRGD